MVVVFFARRTDECRLRIIRRWAEIFAQAGVEILWHVQLAEALGKEIQHHKVVRTAADVRTTKPDFWIAFGGDGTLLDSLLYVQDTGVPVVGVNLGRLGYLVLHDPEHPEATLQMLQRHEYVLEPRSLLQVSRTPPFLSDVYPYALNDFVMHRGESASTIRVEIHIGDEHLASFSADGVIVATPTGSTAYSLSCGGPLLDPLMPALVITPIAAHNLTIRPFVVPDAQPVRIRLCRPDRAVLSLDTRSWATGQETYQIQRAPFTLNLVRPSDVSFIHSLRRKLHWAHDVRS